MDVNTRVVKYISEVIHTHSSDSPLWNYVQKPIVEFRMDLKLGSLAELSWIAKNPLNKSLWIYVNYWYCVSIIQISSSMTQ